MAASGRVGVGVLLVLLAAVVVVPLLPGDPSAVRLAGVGALWWFAACAAPVVAAVTTCAFLRPPTNAPSSRSNTTVATWASPVVLVTLAARVCAGTPDSPALVLVALVAPLFALLARSADPMPPTNGVVVLATTAAVGLVLWANLSVVADVARPMGVPRHTALVALAATAFLGMTWRAARRPVGDTGVLVGAAGVVLPLVVVGLTVAAPPWTAWTLTASRAALTFGVTSAWVTDGRALERPATLVFVEPHRVTALTPGVYRVVEDTDAQRSTTREWSLAAGDALTLRPGDRLVLEAGARIRFEPGKRVPGSAASGAAWADPPERRSPQTAAHALGAALTFVGGALALLPRPGPRPWRRAVAGPALLLVLTLAVVCWGIYAVYAAPDLMLAPPPGAGLVELPAVVLSAPGGRALVATCVLALLLLWVATALALRDVLAAYAGPASADIAWAGLLTLAVVAGFWPGDPWRAWLAGCGLAAASVAAPRFAGGGAHAGLAGSLAGALAFAGLAAVGGRLPSWAGAVAAYPALVAAPLAWVVVRVAGAPRG